jgi:plasmid stabilization system protein ParE
MNFSVVWTRRAENELAAIWLTASDRNAVTQAAHRLDQRLANDPLNEGESRHANYRIAFENPLGILFEVDEDINTVWVLQVWVTG